MSESETQEKQKITKLYCMVATEEDGSEGIPAIISMGIAMPVVASRMNPDDWTRTAKQLVKDGGRPIKILKFTHFEVLGEIQPNEV